MKVVQWSRAFSEIDARLDSGFDIAASRPDGFGQACTVGDVTCYRGYVVLSAVN
jgi:hypothetical protein